MDRTEYLVRLVRSGSVRTVGRVTLEATGDVASFTTDHPSDLDRRGMTLLENSLRASGEAGMLDLAERLGYAVSIASGTEAIMKSMVRQMHGREHAAFVKGLPI